MPVSNSRRVVARAVLPVALLALSAVAASAQTINVSRFGIYESFGQFSHSPNTGSLQRYDVGKPAETVESRNYFVFNLAGVSGTVTGATLRIFSNSTPQVDPAQNYTLGIFEVATPITTLTDSPEGIGAYGPIFTDLGDGTLYGSTSLNPAAITTGTQVDIPLTNALVAINGAGTGQFAVGGTITNLAGVTQALFFSGGVNGPGAQLILTTSGGGGTANAPEPGTFALALLALPGVFAVARRRS